MAKSVPEITTELCMDNDLQGLIELVELLFEVNHPRLVDLVLSTTCEYKPHFLAPLKEQTENEELKKYLGSYIK